MEEKKVEREEKEGREGERVREREREEGMKYTPQFDHVVCSNTD